MEHYYFLHVDSRYDLCHPLRLIVRHTAALLAKAVAHPYLPSSFALEDHVGLELHVARQFDKCLKLSEERKYLAKLYELLDIRPDPFPLLLAVPTASVAEIVQQTHAGYLIPDVASVYLSVQILHYI